MSFDGTARRSGQSVCAALLAVAALAPGHLAARDAQLDQRVSTFRSGVETINVTTTVTNKRGEFVAGLKASDFKVYEDGQVQPIAQFLDERVPISVGVLIDTSASMAGEKLAAARVALGRLFRDLLNPMDQIFLYKVATQPTLIQNWTLDRAGLADALDHVIACGHTALYDAVIAAVDKVQNGQYPKKALLIVTDGNDTFSDADILRVRKVVRQAETLIYAIGIEGRAYPFPVLRDCGEQTPQSLAPLNVSALHTMTDDTGGHTELIEYARDLDGATARIADELSRQYTLGYVSTGKRDNRWHNIKVEVSDKSLRVRARRGYVARR